MATAPRSSPCGLVRFTPGARTNWHRHANGQLLVCTDGVGLVGTRDGKTVVLRAGESVWTPAGEEHFHGGTAENMMCHYAILDASGDGEATTWLEPVTDEQYPAAHTHGGGVVDADQRCREGATTTSCSATGSPLWRRPTPS